jgi:hypothetical protein
MKSQYKGLVFVSVLLRIIAVVLVLGGVGLCLWFFFGSERGWLSLLYSIAGISGSLIAGIVVYTFGEVVSFVLDVWAEVVGKDRDKGH